MTLIHKDVFVCLDCETTGLDPDKDEIIEFAIARFNFDTIIDSFETLIEPSFPISEESTAIHHITDQMVKGKPKIQEILPRVFELINNYIIVGHGITNDISFCCNFLIIDSSLCIYSSSNSILLIFLIGS